MTFHPCTARADTAGSADWTAVEASDKPLPPQRAGQPGRGGPANAESRPEEPGRLRRKHRKRSVDL
jgi:hypothetical protein